MNKTIRMIEVHGIQQYAHEDGSITYHDPETGIAQTFLDGQQIEPEPGTCPVCGSKDIITHHHSVLAPGDQSYTRICAECGRELLI